MAAQKFKGECGSDYHALAQDMALKVAMEDVQKFAQEESVKQQQQQQSTKMNNGKENISSSDIAEMDSDDDFLMNDPELERLREQRIRELKSQAINKNELKTKGHGSYEEVDENDFLTAVTDKSSPLVVCHFYHREFMACRIMDKHLSALAPTHWKTKFIKIEAEKAPFFVAKLAIRVLPTVVLFRDGIAVDRLVGFEDPMLGASDECTTRQVEKRLSLLGIIEIKQSSNVVSKKNGIYSKSNNDSDDDSN